MVIDHRHDIKSSKSSHVKPMDSPALLRRRHSIAGWACDRSLKMVEYTGFRNIDKFQLVVHLLNE